MSRHKARHGASFYAVRTTLIKRRLLASASNIILPKVTQFTISALQGFEGATFYDKRRIYRFHQKYRHHGISSIYYLKLSEFSIYRYNYFRGDYSPMPDASASN